MEGKERWRGGEVEGRRGGGEERWRGEMEGRRGEMEGRRGEVEVGGERWRGGGGEVEGRRGGWENGKGAREAVVTSEIGHIRNTGTLLHVHTPCTL